MARENKIIVTNHKACAYVDAMGKTWFVLFYESYEGCSSSKIPSWKCRFFGGLDGAIKRIFEDASLCEIGSFRAPHKKILPEAYIKQWLKKLASPEHLKMSRDERIEFFLLSFRDQVALRDRLVRIGREDAFSQFKKNGCYEASMHTDAELIAAMVEPVEIASEIVSTRSCNKRGLPANKLGYKPQRVQVSPYVPPEALRFGRGDLIWLEEGCEDLPGSLRITGRKDVIVEKYVRNSWELEISEPGAFERNIPLLRESLNNLELLPVGSKVIVDETVSVDSFEKRDIERYKAYASRITESGYEIDFTQDVIDDPIKMGNISWLPKIAAQVLIKGRTLA